MDTNTENREAVVGLVLGAARELGVVGSEAGLTAECGGVFSLGTTDGDSVDVVLTYDEANVCFNLCARVGDAPADDDLLYESLLLRNFLTRQTDGAAFAIDPEEAVVLQRDVTVAGTDAAALAGAVRSVAVQTASARKALAAREEEEEPSEQPLG